LELVESSLFAVIHWVKLILEGAGAVLVGIGGLAALGRLLVQAVRTPGKVRFTPVRLYFARFLSLALEFQLGADILGTTLAPTWEQLGKLGAIAVIRTGLNYFLGREMTEEREMLAGERAVDEGAVESRAPQPAAPTPSL
jgi:uncharacterized membrane protein